MPNSNRARNNPPQMRSGTLTAAISPQPIQISAGGVRRGMGVWQRGHNRVAAVTGVSHRGQWTVFMAGIVTQPPSGVKS